MTIEAWLTDAARKFDMVDIPTSRLDAELILCHMLGVDRTWLVAHGEQSLLASALSQKGGVRRTGLKEYGEQLVVRRQRREPLAYLFGSKEFYGRDFIVDKNVLVPRPETETLIELAKKHSLSGDILDVGTGSGCLGLSLKLEIPTTSLTLIDISEEALDVAKKNAKKLKVTPVSFIASDLLEAFANDRTFDVIAANLPYVDRSWQRSPELEHEPSLALFAYDGGLRIIKRLIDEAPGVMKNGAHLLLEADPEQMDGIIAYAKEFTLIERSGYGLLMQKT